MNKKTKYKQMKINDVVERKTRKTNIKCLFDGYEFSKEKNTDKIKLYDINEHYKKKQNINEQNNLYRLYK